jgi:hypothetical protein
VRHLASLLFLRDEVVFTLYLAHTADAVRAAAERAGLPVERVTESLFEFPAGATPSPCAAEPGSPS